MSRDMPLVFQAFNWSHGVYCAATMGSEATAAAEAGLPPLRRDPMAMLPFCGYNMADYFSNWLDLGRKIPNPPRIFRVNWFRRAADGKFLWPGFNENVRVLSWIVDRIHGRAFALESPFGWMPRYEDLPWASLDFAEASFRDLMAIDRDAAASEVRQHEELFDRFLDKPGSGAKGLAEAVGVPLGELLPVRLVSHHLRLLGVLAATIRGSSRSRVRHYADSNVPMFVGDVPDLPRQSTGFSSGGVSALFVKTLSKVTRRLHVRIDASVSAPGHSR